MHINGLSITANARSEGWEIGGFNKHNVARTPQQARAQYEKPIDSAIIMTMIMIQ